MIAHKKGYTLMATLVLMVVVFALSSLILGIVTSVVSTKNIESLW